MAFVSHRRGLHVTKNKGKFGKPPRYTFYFPSGVVFHSWKGSYSRKELSEINKEGYKLNDQFRESYSMSPKQMREWEERQDRCESDHEWAMDQTTVGEEQDFGA